MDWVGGGKGVSKIIENYRSIFKNGRRREEVSSNIIESYRNLFMDWVGGGKEVSKIIENYRSKFNGGRRKEGVSSKIIENY